MFTGIIQEVGRVKSVSFNKGNMVLGIEAKKIAGKLDIGASISINGACQTVIMRETDQFQVESVRETLTRTNLKALKSGSYVNLELSLGMNDLLHGHLVQGHIDCEATVTEIKAVDGSTILSLDYPRNYEKYVIEKGSIAIDGVSLTITKALLGSLSVSIIPHTMQSTIFLYRKVGDRVNLEFDIIAKYIERMISPLAGKISTDFLKEHGY